MPVVMLLGSYHMANPGRDLYNVQADDVLAPQRQIEIVDCVERLARFQPTKIALEIRTERGGDLNQSYQAYRAGEFELARSEHHQLGFRLAAQLGHERVYAIDWNGTESFAYGLEVPLEFAEAHQPAIYHELREYGERSTSEANALLSCESITGILCQTNQPERLAASHRFYLKLAQIGEGQNYVGIGWVQGWYARNLRIFVNLCRIVTDPADRVLVIYGAGHIPLLHRFIQDSGQFEVESVLDYFC